MTYQMKRNNGKEISFAFLYLTVIHEMNLFAYELPARPRLTVF
jgi:hypothetical protein